ncbi:DUF1049 domain-containing protein [Streptomyces sp. NPDC001922]|uniref:DUF1049 domain-containing protein n=1 Tax=Streptomyces sp. NPDC001922 TaxID=3364624 RepID=UPI003686335D
MSPKTSTSRGGRSRGAKGRFLESMTPGRVAVIVVAVLALVFILENTAKTKIRLIVPEVIMPLWVALLAMVLIGILCGAYLFRRRR